MPNASAMARCSTVPSTRVADLAAGSKRLSISLSLAATGTGKFQVLFPAVMAHLEILSGVTTSTVTACHAQRRAPRQNRRPVRRHHQLRRPLEVCEILQQAVQQVRQEG